MALAMETKLLVVKEGLLMLLSELFILMVDALHKKGASARDDDVFSSTLWAAAFSMIIKIALDPQHHTSGRWKWPSYR